MCTGRLPSAAVFAAPQTALDLLLSELRLAAQSFPTRLRLLDPDDFRRRYLCVLLLLESGHRCRFSSSPFARY
jgi:hypothetical protein